MKNELDWLKKDDNELEYFKSYLLRRYQDAVNIRAWRSKRFIEAYRYYAGLEPVKGDNELSDYVEPIVRKAVDKVMPSLLNIFTENEEQAVVFRPQRTTLPPMVIDGVNRKINDIFLRKNNGYNLLTNALREGLITGDAFFKVFVEEEAIEEVIDGDKMPIPIEMVMMLLQDFPDTDIEKMKTRTQKVENPQTGEKEEAVMLDGKLKMKRIDRKQKIDFVPFDDLYPLTDTLELQDTRYICHKIKTTVGELIEMGFDKDKVMLARIDNQEDGIDLNMREFMNTHRTIEIVRNTASLQDELERVAYLYEHYVYTSLLGTDDKGGSKLYQVFCININDVLEINEIERIPFVKGSPDNMPGSFWGSSLYDTLKQYQDYISGIIRDIYQRGKQNTYMRWEAVKDQYDRQSLLQISRPGAVLEVVQPGAVKPLLLPQAAPELTTILQTIQQSSQDEMLNAIGGNVDPAALTNIAASTMAMAVHNAEMKDKKIAKSFAYTLIRPLFELMYNMIRDYDLDVEVDMPDGSVQIFRGADLPERSEFYIDVNTANDDAMQAQQLNNLATMLSQVSQMPSPVMTPENLYNVAAHIMKCTDIEDIDRFITNPAQNQPSPEEQMMQKQMEMEQLQRQNDLADAQIGVQVATQAKLEVETSEIIKNGEHKRRLEEQNMLVQMEKVEVERYKHETQYEYNMGKVEVKEAELEAEIKMGRNIGLTQ